MKRLINNPFLVFLIVYTIGHIGILTIPRAVFWDDWTLFNTKNETILGTFREAGDVFNLFGLMHVFLLGLGVWVYKYLTFVVMYLSGCFLFLVLKRQSWISNDAAFFTTILFLVLPLNTARVSLICMPYTMCYFIFFLAWYLVVRHRILSLLLFFLSFLTPSFLVFFILPLAELFFRETSGKKGIKDLVRWALSRIDFIIIPVLFWTIKILFFKPYGLFKGYNEQFSLRNLIYVPKAMLKDLLKLRIGYGELIVAAVIFVVGIAYKSYRTRSGKLDLVTKNKLVLTAGVLALGAGLFPYWILGYTPTFYEWSSRHQLLMPLGCALIFYGTIQFLPKTFKSYIFLFIVCVSVAVTAFRYRDFYNDETKQEKLLRFFATSPEVQQANVVLIEDSTRKAIARNYRFYELTGMMKLALGNESKLCLTSWADLESYREGQYDKYFLPSYNAGAHKREGSEKILSLKIVYNQQNMFGPSTYDIIQTRKIE
jgi:hypothetical protein